MLVDAASPTWSVLYSNDAFTAATGAPPGGAAAASWASPAALGPFRPCC